MKKLLNGLLENKIFLLILVSIGIGAFLRFYRLDFLAMFLGDQGRDAIIIKKILTLEHLTAIGASTSVGMIFLGPFYYYFISPWLWLFKFHPSGLAYGVAFFSVIYLFVNYFIVNELIGKRAAFFSTILITFSFVMISYSRFSWNPNLMPLFALLTAYFLYKAFETKNSWYFALSGSCLSFCVQLHYLALFLFPAFITYFLYESFLQKKEEPLFGRIYDLLISAAAFLFFYSPLIIFDLRHEFINSKAFLNLITKTGTETVAISKIDNFMDAFYHLNKYVFDFEFNRLVLYCFLVIILAMIIYAFKNNKKNIVLLIFFFFSILGVGFYSGPKNMHYFVAVYPFYFIIIGYFLAILSRNIFGKVFVIYFLYLFLTSNYNQYLFLKEEGYSQIDFARRVARVIFDNSKGPMIQIASLPSEYSESTYRYFVDLWGRKVMERDSLEKVDELFIVCEKSCKPIGDPQWDIAYFAPKKVDNTWIVDGVTIYKLSH